MNEKIEAYAKSLNFSAPLLARLRQLHEICLPFVSEIDDAFIGQTKDQDGSDQYSGLLFFNTALAVVFKDLFDPEAIFHIVPLRNIAVVNLTCGAVQIHPGSPDTITPRMIATLVWPPNVQMQALATGQVNCDHLISLYEKYILPALAGREVPVNR
jgi:hypothetical protein